MGLFDNLFERKTCDICGGKCGVLGGTKVADGRLCKDCVRKLSPWLNNLKQMTLDEVREHLEYREANNELVKQFNITHVIGDRGDKLYLDMENHKMVVSGSSNWRNLNPDVIDFSQLVGSDLKITENKREIMKEDAEGKKVSYNPKRYEYSYNFSVPVDVNSPWFNAFTIRVVNSSVEGFDSEEYEEAYLLSEEFCEVLSALKDGSAEEINEIIDYYKTQRANKRKYDNTYYADTKSLKRGADYYRDRDPRRNHYKF
ncbi:MAG: DUF4428 domain-containing protein [Erysipelotrichaceae bacterium]|nr:DUF4428 domain-containing protein [Erysipelotrichaceae bacterium]